MASSRQQGVERLNTAEEESQTFPRVPDPRTGFQGGGRVYSDSYYPSLDESIVAHTGLPIEGLEPASFDEEMFKKRFRALRDGAEREFSAQWNAAKRLYEKGTTDPGGSARGVLNKAGELLYDNSIFGIFDEASRNRQMARGLAIKDSISGFLDAYDRVIADPSPKNFEDFAPHGVRAAEAFAGSAAASALFRVGGTLAETAGVANSGVRETVLANLRESAVARSSSQIETFFAKSAQIESGYAADAWNATLLRQGDVVYALSPTKNPQFFTDLPTLQAVQFDTLSASEALQVRPHSVYGYRPDVTGYRVTQDITIPSGTTAANPWYGPGGGTQFFIRDSGNYLEPISTINLRPR